MATSTCKGIWEIFFITMHLAEKISGSTIVKDKNWWTIAVLLHVSKKPLQVHFYNAFSYMWSHFTLI